MVNNCWLLLGCSSSHYVSNDTCGDPIYSAHIFPLRHSSCGNPTLLRCMPSIIVLLSQNLFKDSSFHLLIFYYLLDSLKIRIAPQFGVEQRVINSKPLLVNSFIFFSINFALFLALGV